MPDLPAAGFPRLTYLRIKNYRALRDVELRDLTPLTVLIGPNGSGKSTVLDALAFLAEAVSGNLKRAWEKRNRFAGMRTRDSSGPIEFELRIIVNEKTLEYKVSFQEDPEAYTKEVFVENESFHLLDDTTQSLFQIISKGEEIGHNQNYPGAPFVNGYSLGKEKVAAVWTNPQYLYIRLAAVSNVPDPLNLQGMASTLSLILEFYRYIHLTDDHLKGFSDAGPREKLSSNGDNLTNVLYYLHEQYPHVLRHITIQLQRWVPQLAGVVTEITSDERLLLRFKDAPFEKPLPAQYMSDGTMRLAALLTLLYEPNATGLLGIEEPENELHPRLLPRLAEELIQATETRQLLVATHSPALLNSMEPEQVWILHRGTDGYTQASRVADMPDIVAMVEEGSPLGYLWSRNFFEVGDPLASPSATPTQE